MSEQKLEGRKILPIPYDDLEALLLRKDYVITNLPRDMKVIACHEDYVRQCIAVVIESAEFGLCSCGDVMPDFEPMFADNRRGEQADTPQIVTQ